MFGQQPVPHTRPERPESVQYGSQARKYRSKRQRPCDLCRQRKTQCKIPDNGGACELCAKLGRGCTFVLQPLRKERWRPQDGQSNSPQEQWSPPGHQSHSAQQRWRLPETPSNSAQHRGTQSDTTAYNGDPMAIDVGTFETADLQLDIDVDSQTMPLVSDQLSFLGQQSGPQAGAIDWSYLNFPITPLGNDFDFPTRISAASDGSPQAFRSELISPGAGPGLPNQRHEQHQDSVNGTYSIDAIGTHPGDEVEDSASLRDDVSEGLPPDKQEAPRDHEWSDEYSLDERPGYSFQLIGMSGETDPFLLRHYQYDTRDTFRMFGLDFRKVVDDMNMPGPAVSSQTSQIPAGDIPIQFVMTNEEICEEDVKIIDKDFSGFGTEAEDHDLLYKLVPVDLGSRLLKLFFKFIQPSYPVLSSHDHNGEYRGCNCTTGLRAAVYALAAPYYFLDDYLSVDRGYQQPSTEELWGIAHRGLHRDSRKSHLGLVQLSLLLLHRPPQNYAVADIPCSWALACSVLADAETLGLNLDPSDWKLPSHEIRLRKRLWWLVHIEHTWRALVLGRPSHIGDSNWDVSELTGDDFDLDDFADAEARSAIRAQCPYFMALCSLSTIASQVLDALYSIKSIRQATSLEALLVRAQPLRMRIQQWRQKLPPDVLKPTKELMEEDGLDNCGPLRLTYLTLELLVFRALLRPLAFPPGTSEEVISEPRSTIFQNSQSCAKLVLELVAALKANHFVNFWPSYTRYQLSYMTNFALLLFVQSPSMAAAKENKLLLDKWRGTVRMQSRAWPVLRLAAMRLDAVVWKGLDHIVSWAGKDSPAEILLRKPA
ncbi:fungal-specific transcription factor domain-containing protein [Exophiala viscosa]|uniref:fungal-specific transcription factor domain-containing protein n=1 Tax=Exophiala viscosa TaxID=2486360 RepID=UPI0021966A68|nr:fungal-specific transcription factor domain-containing protein [Exophiala viscosa]